MPTCPFFGKRMILALGKTKERGRNRPRESRLKATVRTVERRRAIRRRVFTALVLLIGLPALAVGAYWGGREAWRAMFAENDFFQIRQIEVTTDGVLGAADIREHAKVREGLNLFAVRPQDIREALLHVAIYAGVPAANHAFKIVKKAYEEMGEKP